MDGKTLDELRGLVEFLKANEIAEFDMEQADLKVRIKFAGGNVAAGSVAQGIDAAQLSRLMASAAPAAGAPVAASHVGAAPAAAEENLHEVKSPIVGTF